MTNENAVLISFESPLRIASAIRRVRSSGFNIIKISVIWRDEPSKSEVTGYYKAGDCMKYWGGLDVLWNEIFDELSGWALYIVPDIGSIVVVGPLAGWIATALSNAPIFGDMSAIGMGLYSVSISRSCIRFCEDALKQGRFFLLLNGPAQEVKKAKKIIDELKEPVSIQSGLSP